MELQRAERSDVEEIKEIFVSAKQQMTLMGITQWTSYYPEETQILEDIDAGDLLVSKNAQSEIVSLGTLTHRPFEAGNPSQYTDQDWFIKRLVTSSRESGKGLGVQWIESCLESCCEQGSRVFSLTNHTNWLMQKVFCKTGFKKIEEVVIEERKTFGPFYVYRRDR